METFDLVITVPIPTLIAFFDLLLVYFLIGSYVVVGILCHSHISKFITFRKREANALLVKMFVLGSLIWPYILYWYFTDQPDR